jgi:hypothetical protein
MHEKRYSKGKLTLKVQKKFPYVFKSYLKIHFAGAIERERG